MANMTDRPYLPTEAYGQRQSFQQNFDVQLVPQQHTMSCWAAAAAMVVGWSRQMSIPGIEIARRIGYWRQYEKPAHQGGGLDPEDEKVFDAWGMKAEEPQSYTTEAFYDLFATYGPLWVAAMVGGPHVRVIYGMEGDGTPGGTTLRIHDPSPVGAGSSYTRTYEQFVAEMEQLAYQELGKDAKRPLYERPLYIAHMREPIASWQGAAQHHALGSRAGRGCIVIDAGHGGHAGAGRSTPYGVQGPDGAAEKDMTLALARSVAEHAGGDVVLTRDRDVNLSLAERCAVARQYGARAFVSIHAGDNPHGSETYVHPQAKAGSRVLARSIQRRLAVYGAVASELQHAPMAVLTPERLTPDTAACLIEVDGLSGRYSARGQRDPAAMTRLGSAIADGIEQFLGERQSAVAHGHAARRAEMRPLSRLNAQALGSQATIVLDHGHDGIARTRQSQYGKPAHDGAVSDKWKPFFQYEAGTRFRVDGPGDLNGYGEVIANKGKRLHFTMSTSASSLLPIPAMKLELEIKYVRKGRGNWAKVTVNGVTRVDDNLEISISKDRLRLIPSIKIPGEELQGIEVENDGSDEIDLDIDIAGWPDMDFDLERI